MKTQSKISALVLSLVLLSLSGLANAAFTKGMTNDQIAFEVKAQIKAGKELKAIFNEAKLAGVNTKTVESALIAQGQSPTAVLAATASESKNSDRSNSNPQRQERGNNNRNETHETPAAGGGGAKEPVASPHAKQS